MNQQKNWLFLAFSCLLFFKAGGQTVQQTWILALEEENIGHYESAILKYRRIQFFRTDTLTVQIPLHIGNCYLFLKDYRKAKDSYENALISDIYKKDRNEILLQILKADILSLNMRFALKTIREIDTLKDTNARDQVIFYYGVIRFYKEEYNDAEKTWMRLLAANPEKQKQLHGLFTENQKINRLKPGIAIALSVLLPGAGQIYAGDLKNGLNSFLLNGAIFALGYNTTVAYGLLNAIIAVGPWYLRYYQGGFSIAGELVLTKRTRQHAIIYQKILDLLKK